MQSGGCHEGAQWLGREPATGGLQSYGTLVEPLSQKERERIYQFTQGHLSDPENINYITLGQGAGYLQEAAKLIRVVIVT